MCDPAAVQDVDERAMWAAAGAVCAALVAHDMDALRALTAEELWVRAAAEELAPLAEHAVAARPLGLLGRHTMLYAATPGAAYPAYVVEQQWTPAAARPLVEDERLFTLIDRAEVEASGEERLARLRTKLDAQDAALAYVAALNGHDPAAATAMWSTAHDEGPGQEVPPQISSVRRAELIGSVGPRTLVWLAMDDGEATVELLWRRRDGRLLIEGARTFTPGAAA
jgi:hypothetical protein